MSNKENDILLEDLWGAVEEEMPDASQEAKLIEVDTRFNKLIDQVY